MKELVLLKTNTELLKTILCLAILKLNMNLVSRRKWNLICALQDKLPKHQGGGGHFRWEGENC